MQSEIRGADSLAFVQRDRREQRLENAADRLGTRGAHFLLALPDVRALLTARRSRADRHLVL